MKLARSEFQYKEMINSKQHIITYNNKIKSI